MSEEKMVVGSPVTFVRKFERKLQGWRRGENRDVEVPCGSCTACCRSGYAVHITEDEAKVLLKHHRTEDGTLVLDKKDGKECVYLQGGQCSVYGSRPETCRIYDCRLVSFVGGRYRGENPINKALERWEFPIKTREDVSVRLAVSGLMRDLAPQCNMNLDEAAVTAIALFIKHRKEIDKASRAFLSMFDSQESRDLCAKEMVEQANRRTEEMSLVGG